MHIRQPTRIAMKYNTGAFDNVVVHDWVEEAPEAITKAISGMLTDTDNFEEEHHCSIVCSNERSFVLLLADVGRVMIALMHASSYLSAIHRCKI